MKRDNGHDSDTGSISSDVPLGSGASAPSPDDEYVAVMKTLDLKVNSNKRERLKFPSPKFRRTAGFLRRKSADNVPSNSNNLNNIKFDPQISTDDGMIPVAPTLPMNHASPRVGMKGFYLPYEVDRFHVNVGAIVRNHNKEAVRASTSGNADSSHVGGGVPVLTRWVFRANKEDEHPSSQQTASAFAQDERKTASSNLRPRAISDISFELKHEHDLIAERRMRNETKSGAGRRAGFKHSEKEKS